MPPNLTSSSTGWRSPVILLMAMAAVMQIGFAAWTNLSNNFAVEILGFSGREIGIQQSVREIPGFMAFAAVFFLLIMREQTLAYISLLLLGGAVAVTGYYPTFTGFSPNHTDIFDRISLLRNHASVIEPAMVAKKNCP